MKTNGGCFLNLIYVPKSKRMQDNAVLFYYFISFTFSVSVNEDQWLLNFILYKSW